MGHKKILIWLHKNVSIKLKAVKQPGKDYKKCMLPGCKRVTAILYDDDCLKKKKK